MTGRRLGPAIAASLVAVLLAIAFAATRLTVLQGTANSARGGRAPEFVGIEAWLNGEPRTLADLRGEVVLLDFWTYSCINCIRTLPHLRTLYEAYRPYGLEVIGVHAPEFSFERDIDNVRAALARYEVAYPVALDNQMRTWDAYANRYWPHVYLIDADGTIRYDHIGEGGEEEIQSQIRSLMTEAGLRLPSPVSLSARGPSANITPEVYLGAHRGGAHLGNPEGYRGGVVDYEPVASLDDVPGDGTFFLEGPWRAEPEHVEPARSEARLHLPFFARDVFVVADGTGPVRVLLDGRRLKRAAGDDVSASGIRVDRSDLFSIVRLHRAERHVLTLVAGPGVRFYTFTFG